MFGVIIDKGLKDWEIVGQKNGLADISISGYWIPLTDIIDKEINVFARIVKEDSGENVIWWTKAKDLGDKRWSIIFKDIPVGGLYRIETSLQQDDKRIEWLLRGDMIHHIGVGDVYIIAGQSNASGFGKDAIVDPPEIGVHLLKNSGKWDLATHPMSDSTNTIHPDNIESGNPGHSPYLAFAKFLKKELKYPIGLIQASQGGSPLSKWNPAEKGNLYQSMLETVKTMNIYVKGILWYQGCSDTDDNLAETYLKRFENMVSELKKDLNNPNLHILTAQLNRHIEADRDNNNGKGWGLVREAQRMASKQIEGVYVIPTTDCGLSDQIHNSAHANILIGERLAKTALYRIYNGKPYSAPNIIFAKKENSRTVRLIFENVIERLFYLGEPDELPFTIQDQEGNIKISNFTENLNEIIIELERDIKGNAIVHGVYEKNPCNYPPVDIYSRLPMLSFYGMDIN
jgi:hypothetical protein